MTNRIAAIRIRPDSEAVYPIQVQVLMSDGTIDYYSKDDPTIKMLMQQIDKDTIIYDDRVQHDWEIYCMLYGAEFPEY